MDRGGTERKFSPVLQEGKRSLIVSPAIHDCSRLYTTAELCTTGEWSSLSLRAFCNYRKITWPDFSEKIAIRAFSRRRNALYLGVKIEAVHTTEGGNHKSYRAVCGRIRETKKTLKFQTSVYRGRRVSPTVKFEQLITPLRMLTIYILYATKLFPQWLTGREKLQAASSSSNDNYRW